MRIAGVHYMSKKLDEIIKNAIEEEALLERQKRILEREDARIKREKLRPLIGMAFKRGNTYFKITNVPQIEWDGEEMRFNPYRIPCLTLFDQLGQVIKKSEDTMFTNAINSTEVQEYIRKEYQEITSEQFQEKLNKAMEA